MMIYKFTPEAQALVDCMDYLGIIAFAISGVFRVWHKKYSYLGIIFIFPIAVAYGGGVMRDVLRGRPVPALLQNPSYFILMVGIAAAMMGVKMVMERAGKDLPVSANSLLEVCDAIGLSAFAIMGAYYAIYNDKLPEILPFIPDDQPDAFKLSVWVAVPLFSFLTGAGGGVLRDILAMKIPYAFTASNYLFFPILGGVVFLLCVNLGEGEISRWVIVVPTLTIMFARLTYWYFLEYERKQYVSLVLIRNENGCYLMEEGASKAFGLIGGRYDDKDGKEGLPRTFERTAIRKVKDELGLDITENDWKQIVFPKCKFSISKNGLLTYRDRSIRTGEMVKYYIAVFDFKRLLDVKTMDQIRDFRHDSRKNRKFAEINIANRVIRPLDEVFPPNVLSSQNKEGMIMIDGEPYAIMLSSLRRIKTKLPKDYKNHEEDGKEIFYGLPK